MNHHTVSVEVEDKPGALARVSQMFARRGYNITSLAVGPTERTGVSRLTMRVDCSEHSFEQIEKQMHKLVNVLRVTELPPDESVERELALITVNAPADKRAELIQLGDVFGARVADIGREALGVEHLLPLPNHPEPAVVDDDGHDRQALEDGRGDLLRGHLEAAVAVDADDGRVGAGRLRADRGRHAVAHRPEAARGDERARPIADEVLHRPHLVLADARRPHHVVAARSQVAEPLHHRLRLDAVGAAVRVPVREFGLPVVELAEPGAGEGSVLCPEGSNLARQLGEREPQGPDDGDVRVAELSDLRRVDIEVDDLRAGRESCELAGDAVVDVRCDPEEKCFPMIPAGAAATDMLEFDASQVPVD